MEHVLLPTLAKAALPLFGIVAILVVARKKGLSLVNHFGFRRPKPLAAVLFLIAWVTLIALEEAAGHALGTFAAKPWPAFPMLIIALRVLAIGILGPIAEEIAVRGLLFGFVARTKMGPYGAIVVTALAWAFIHFQYEPVVLTFIVIDGLVLGLARHKTASLWVPIAMHIIGNLFSIYQSLNP